MRRRGGGRLAAGAPLGALAVAAAVLAGCGPRVAVPPPPFTLAADSLGETALPAVARRPENLAKACDGSGETRWTSAAPIAAGYFVELAFPRERAVSALTLDAAPSRGDAPDRVLVEVSRDGRDWEELGEFGPSPAGDGKTRIDVKPPRPVRRIMVRVLEPAPHWWSIYEVTVEYARD